jgi:glycosyltransferase involved in cell wall biosynthesis
MIDPKAPDYGLAPSSFARPSFFFSPVDQETRPAVSIITPFYNPGEVFHETAKTVLQQSFQQWEWIIVDDGSTDRRSLEILDEYRGRDARIRIIDAGCNKGPSSARNAAIKVAKADYIVQLDADNLLEPTAVEKWLWFLESFPEYSFVKGYSVGFGAENYLWDRGFHRGEAFLTANQVDTTSMIRKEVHAAVGGYDETIREGFEDWEFWLRCASNGYWGGTIPEYLDWYRRRSDHSVQWKNWDGGRAQEAFLAMLRERHAKLWEGKFPKVSVGWHVPNATITHSLPFPNHLSKKKPRLLMILPWLTTGGSDKFNLDLLRQLNAHGWEVSVATTLPGDETWLPVFARETPDIFILHHFLRLVDYPRFLRYLIHSRQVDAVYISHSEFAYLLLPYLRAYCPGTAFFDFCHIDEPFWKNGGYPRMSVEFDDMLDLHVVSSNYLKRWMTERGAPFDRAVVSYTNVDVDVWRPHSEDRENVRRELGLDNEVPVILYAARLCAQKQPKTFAQTILRLRDTGCRFVAVVAGGGPDLAWLTNFIATHELMQHVVLLGTTSSEKVRGLMAAADVFFLPSQWEGIAVTFFEAMASGLAVVGADVGGQRELVTPECGVLIAPGDETYEIATYTAVLTELLSDRSKRVGMGMAGRVRVSDNFKIEQMAERMLGYIDQARSSAQYSPRLQPSIGLAHACASMAVEYTRLDRVADMLWNRNGIPLARKAQFYRALRYFEPAFTWAVKQGFTWLIPLKELAKRRLFSPT